MADDQITGDAMTAWDDEELPRLSERLLRGLAAAQTPRQQEIAKSIYGRLRAGDSVDDIKDLIAEMSRVVTKEQGFARRTSPAPSGRQPEPAERPGRERGA